MRPMFALVWCAAVALHAQQAGVAGTVVDQTTAQPLRGVHVRLLSGDFDGGGIDTVFGAMTDEAGRFSAEGMKPGFYLVIAERTGFVQVTAENSPMPFGTLGLKPDQHVTDFKIVMVAHATISGRVVDEYGDPVEHTSIQTEPVPPAKEQASMFGGRNATTDDRGEFRLSAPPGKYFLVANRFDRGGAVEIQSDGTVAQPYVKTYFPSAPNSGQATVVQVGAGQNVAGLEIRLLRGTAGRGPARSFTISGTVTGIPDNGTATVELRTGEAPEQLFNGRSVRTNPDGTFLSPGMQPGYYSVTARYEGSKSLQSRAVEFHLDSHDETNLQLVLLPGAELNGAIEFTGAEAAARPEQIAVRLESARFDFSGEQRLPPAAPVGKDGSFGIGNVLPGKFKLVVEPLPENAYIKQIALDGKTVADGVLDFSQGVGGSRLKITISRSGAQVSGRVLGKDGEPEAGMMMVFCATDPKTADEETAKRTSNGTFAFQALPPGKYHLFALDIAELISVFAGGDDQTELMQRFFDAAEIVDLEEGGHVQRDIKAFTKLPEKK